MMRVFRLAFSTARLSSRSSIFFANRGTIIVSLLLTPLLEIIFAVLMGASLDSPNLVMTSYRSALVAAAVISCTAVCMAAVYDREQQITEEIFARRIPNIGYWLGVTLPALAAGLITGVVTIGAILLVDPQHDITQSVYCLSLLPIAVMSGAGLGVLSAGMGLLFRDPYAVLNVITPLLPLTAGVVVPLVYYPHALRMLCSWVPLSVVVNQIGQPVFSWIVVLLIEAGKAAVCVLVGIGIASLVVRRRRVRAVH